MQTEKQPEEAPIMAPKIAVDRSRIEAFCRKWEVKEFSLFGSVLTDDFEPDSDVDVLVTLDEDARCSLFEWVDMIDELKDIFGRDVDLVEKTAIRNPFRRHRILRTHEVVYVAR
jgi:predicted nucleotidyltransferase